MWHSRSSLRISLAGLGLALAHVGAQADLLTYFAAQGPKTDLFDPLPPSLGADIQAQMAAFNAAISPLGGQEFEAGSMNFSYTGGTATVSGSPMPVLVGDPPVDRALGRYNATPGLLDPLRRSGLGTLARSP